MVQCEGHVTVLLVALLEKVLDDRPILRDLHTARWHMVDLINTMVYHVHEVALVCSFD